MKRFADALMATSNVDIRAAAGSVLFLCSQFGLGVDGPEGAKPWRGKKSYDNASMSSLVLYSFNSLIASNSHTIALVRLFPALPGFA